MLRTILIAINLCTLLFLAGRCFQLDTQLPEHVASHFGQAGLADAFTPRRPFLISYAAAAVVLTGLFLGFAAAFSHMKPWMINLPNRAYWLAEERRAETHRAFAHFMLGFAFAMNVLLIAILEMIAAAHQVEPPRLANTPFMVMMGGYMTFVAFWTWALYRRFAKPQSV